MPFKLTLQFNSCDVEGWLIVNQLNVNPIVMTLKVVRYASQARVDKENCAARIKIRSI